MIYAKDGLWGYEVTVNVSKWDLWESGGILFQVYKMKGEEFITPRCLASLARELPALTTVYNPLCLWNT